MRQFFHIAGYGADRLSDQSGGASSPQLSAWERAYQAFETPEQELDKFLGRFRRIGAHRWDRGSRVLEVCSGRGTGVRAWNLMGFKRVVGVDYSPALVLLQGHPGARIIGDARDLPLASGSFDIAIVQGGLHHLFSTFDVDRALQEMCRVVGPNGRIVIIEPWLTPFLRLVHLACGIGVVRRCSPRVQALATMIDEERETYDRWLNAPEEHLGVIRRYVAAQRFETRWGKLIVVGTPAGF